MATAPALDCESCTTPIGVVRVLASAQGIVRIDYVASDEASDESRPSALTRRAIALIEDYFSGKQVIWNLPLDTRGGTPLQRKVWHAIAAVPYGQTITYTELAARIGNPSAIRAAASACGKNPLPLIVPCHRVVAKGGGLGGFGWGLPAKIYLLDLEKVRLTKAA